MCKAIAVISILRDFVAFTTKGVGRSYLFYAPMALKSKTGVRRRETGDRLPTPDFRPGAKKYPISNNQYSISNMVGMGGIPNRSRQTGISAEFIPQSGAPVIGDWSLPSVLSDGHQAGSETGIHANKYFV